MLGSIGKQHPGEVLEFPDRATVDEYLKSLDFQLLSRCERKIVQPPLPPGHKDGGGDHFYGNDGSVLIIEWLYNHSGEEGSAEEESVDDMVEENTIEEND